MIPKLRTSIVVVALFGTGCDSGADMSEPPSGTSEAMAIIARTGPVATIAIADQSERENLTAIADGETPAGFHWIRLVVPAAMLDLSDQTSLDLSQRSTAVGFAQSYMDICNPAKEDTSKCWLHEQYASGDVGLTGSIEMTSREGVIEGRIALSWEGETDRFGDPLQWHRHESEIVFRASVIEQAGEVR